MTFSMGLPGKVTTSFTMAGIVSWGGLLPATLTLSRGMSGSTTLTLAWIFSGVGLLMGLAHGLVLGYAGRPDGMSRHDALIDERHSLRFVPFAAVAAMCGALWVPLSMVLKTDHRWMAAVPVVIGWLVVLSILTWTVGVARDALANAYHRWPESRVGSGLLLLIFASLLYQFAQSPPRVWGSSATFTPIGYVFLASALTIWLAAPLLIVALHLIHTRVFRQRFATRW